MPLEVYVARVLAGEAEPGAPTPRSRRSRWRFAPTPSSTRAAIAATGSTCATRRTARCCAPRTTCPRRAALATAGRVLTLDGKPVEMFYSASCGGQSESAADVWPGGTKFPYLRSVTDDVHEDDVPWMLDAHARRDSAGAGRRPGSAATGCATSRSTSGRESGRVARLRLSGLRPDAIAGDPFRMAIGARQLRSTAFSMTRSGNSVRFTGVGYGHGVGMCVIGAGRRARRGETLEAILAQYFPGLALMSSNASALRAGVSRAGRAVGPPPAAEAPPPRAPVTPPSRPQINVRVPTGRRCRPASWDAWRCVVRESLSKTLGASADGVTVELHGTMDGFRYETGRPWWVSAAVKGTTIDLAPAPLLAQRDGVEATLRTAMAELLVSPVLADRPVWVRVGAARYFARPTPQRRRRRDVKCPADAELTMALSASAQRDAESRAERCFARALAKTGDWRSVR